MAEGQKTDPPQQRRRISVDERRRIAAQAKVATAKRLEQIGKPELADRLLKSTVTMEPETHWWDLI